MTQKIPQYNHVIHNINRLILLYKHKILWLKTNDEKNLGF